MLPSPSFSAILSPSPQLPNIPPTHTQIRLRAFSQTMPALLRFHRAGFAPDLPYLTLPYLFPALLVLLSTQSSPVYPASFHRVLCVFLLGFWVDILGFRSTLPGHFSHYTRLTSGFAGVLRVCQRSSCPPPLHTCRSVFCTHQGSSWRVWNTSPPTASPHRGLRRTSAAPVSPTGERPSSGRAWLSRATRGGSHPPPLRASVVGFLLVFVLLLCFVLGFSIVTLFFWDYMLYPSPPVYPCFCVWVLVTQYTCEITFIGDPDFEASVPQAKGPASSEALPPRTFILSFKFGLPNPSCFCSFIFSM
jgi:hypothetical protein